MTKTKSKYPSRYSELSQGLAEPAEFAVQKKMLDGTKRFQPRLIKVTASQLLMHRSNNKDVREEKLATLTVETGDNTLEPVILAKAPAGLFRIGENKRWAKKAEVKIALTTNGATDFTFTGTPFLSFSFSLSLSLFLSLPFFLSFSLFLSFSVSLLGNKAFVLIQKQFLLNLVIDQ